MRLVALSNIALALASFGLVAGFVRSLTPGPELVASTPKLEYLAEHVDEYDAIFLGSSRVYRHFVPSVIDRRLEELGEPLRTFNLGTPGAGSFEVDELLRRALALEGARFKFVFIEPSEWSPTIFKENRETERTVAWHTLTGTRKALAATWRRNADPKERLELGFMHVRLFGWRLSSLGQGLRIARPFLGYTPKQPISVADVAKTAGYWPLEFERTEGFAARRRELLQDRESFELKISRLPHEGALGGAGTGQNSDLIKEQMRVIREADAEPVYVIPPGTVGTRLFYSQRKFGLLDVLLAFNDPAKFPSYYDYEHFFDRNHLTTEAAKVFSRIFADDFVSWLRGGKPLSLIDEDS